MKDVRELAEKYSHAELERFIEQQIREGKNSGYKGADDEATMGALVKASYVSQLLEEEKAENITDAIRKMAAGMRSLQKNVKAPDNKIQSDTH